MMSADKKTLSSGNPSEISGQLSENIPGKVTGFHLVQGRPVFYSPLVDIIEQQCIEFLNRICNYFYDRVEQ